MHTSNYILVIQYFKFTDRIKLNSKINPKNKSYDLKLYLLIFKLLNQSKNKYQQYIWCQGRNRNKLLPNFFI